MSEIHAILRNHNKEKLGRGELVASMTVRLTRSIEIAQIAKTAGFDTLYVDLEHNTLSIDTCAGASAGDRGERGRKTCWNRRFGFPRRSDDQFVHMGARFVST